EMKIIRRLLELQKIANSFRGSNEQLELIPKSQLSFAASYNVQLFSHISLSQFYGIEIDDFAHEVATLALWLTEHQMNKEFYKEFGRANPTLPLKEAGNITHGNACRLNWEGVCPKNEGDEIYILGNPPYLGSSVQTIGQKKDMSFIFEKIGSYKNLDYISCWFYLAAKYISNFSNSFYAFVTTNSICQGEQVILLWPKIYFERLEINFCYKKFKWLNNAKSKAGVTVTIIGIRNISNKNKYIFEGNLKKEVDNINSYLIDSKDVIVNKRSNPISNLQSMGYGSKLVDGGNLTLTVNEKKELISNYPQAEKYIRRLIGADEMLKSSERFCLWLENKDLEKMLKIPEISKRIEKVKEVREKSKKKATREKALVPYKFGEVRYVKSNHIIVIPRVSSERREYIPFSFVNGEVIISDSAQAIYQALPETFGILISQMHLAWIKSVCGTLESRIRYSSALGYNTFPFPPISEQRKNEITQCVFRILEERAKHSEKTLAQLYDPDKMPDGLREAHRLNDLAVERCYRSKPFETDEERLEYLFKLYERMIAEEKETLKK
ncbi:MAG: class I SAM-dependent DNA methyltransferase, partial [Bacteroidota bacterium]